MESPPAAASGSSSRIADIIATLQRNAQAASQPPMPVKRTSLYKHKTLDAESDSDAHLYPSKVLGKSKSSENLGDDSNDPGRLSDTSRGSSTRVSFEEPKVKDYGSLFSHDQDDGGNSFQAKLAKFREMENFATLEPSRRKTILQRAPVLSYAKTDQSQGEGSAIDARPTAAIGPTKMFWKDQKHVKESGILQTMDSKEIKIQEALFEVITSEESYFKSLDVLVNHFKCKMTEAFQHNKQLKYPVKLMFSNIEVIKDVTETFLGELDKRQGDNVRVCDYTDILVKFAEEVFLQPYTKYSCDQPGQSEIFTDLNEVPEFRGTVKELEADPCVNRLYLQSFLLLPVQRVSRFPLLLKSVVERIPEDDRRHEKYRQAWEATRKFADAVEYNQNKYMFDKLLIQTQPLIEYPSKLEDRKQAFSNTKKSAKVSMFGELSCFPFKRSSEIRLKTQTLKYLFFCWEDSVLVLHPRPKKKVASFVFSGYSEVVQVVNSDDLERMVSITVAPEVFKEGKASVVLLLITGKDVLQEEFLVYLNFERGVNEKWLNAFHQIEKGAKQRMKRQHTEKCSKQSDDDS